MGSLFLSWFWFWVWVWSGVGEGFARERSGDGWWSVIFDSDWVGLD